MSKYIINGTNSNFGGTVRISGSKNAALPIMAASMLSDEDTILDNIPCLSDTETMLKIIRASGGTAERDNHNSVHISLKKPKKKNKPDYELYSKLRGSVLVMSPILARFGHVKLPLPGGCKIGARPIDLHLKGFSAMGAKIKQGHGFVEVSCKDGLKGAKIYLDFPSVGATENIMIAATLANGSTIIENAAEEPEIVDLAHFLCEMGADISGEGTDTVIIKGVPRLHKTNHGIIPDRIEAGTFLICGAVTGGGITLENAEPNHLKPLLAKLGEMGCDYNTSNGSIILTPGGRPKSVDIKTMPYPGFPTDLQAQIMSLLTIADGNGMVVETIFENRFSHIPELCRMGAKIKTEGNAAFIEGVPKLSGADVKATDLRAGAALTAAAIKASGTSEIHDIAHIERGYENFVDKLRSLGVEIDVKE